MRQTVVAGVLALFGPGAVLAQEVMAGDPVAGEDIFGRFCAACHQSETSAESINQGGDLYGIAGRVPGSLPNIFYSDLMHRYAETGAVWDEASFVAFVEDPGGFLRQATGLRGPSAMDPALPPYHEQEAHDVWAYLTSLSPAKGKGAGAEDSSTAPADGEVTSE